MVGSRTVFWQSVMTATLANTPLHDWHVAHGGRMVDFAGWSMPVQYTSIVAEHRATRTAAGLFDISHMGRLRFDGPRAAPFLDRLATRRASKLAIGQVVYALVTNESGGILDDILIYRLADAVQRDYYLVVVNASNREKIVSWIRSRPAADDLQVADLTTDWAMIAVQGPHALQLVAPLVVFDLAAMKYYTATETLIAGHGGIVSRTGYTGEDGVELIVGAAIAPRIWQMLFERSQSEQLGAVAAGLGSRDTLRLEAGMPLYGHELSESVNPFQAGLGFAVDLTNAQFPGAAELARFKADSSQPRRVGLELAGKRVPREGYAILDPAGATIGQVTSGTFSPTFDRPLAMGYVAPQFAAPGAQLAIDIRGRAEPARIAALPFYRRSR